MAMLADAGEKDSQLNCLQYCTVRKEAVEALHTTTAYHLASRFLPVSTRLASRGVLCLQ